MWLKKLIGQGGGQANCEVLEDKTAGQHLQQMEINTEEAMKQR